MNLDKYIIILDKNPFWNEKNVNRLWVMDDNHTNTIINYKTYFSSLLPSGITNPLYDLTTTKTYPNTEYDRTNYTKGEISLDIQQLQENSHYSTITIRDLLNLQYLITYSINQNVNINNDSNLIYEYWYLRIKFIKKDVITYTMELDIFTSSQQRLRITKNYLSIIRTHANRFTTYPVSSETDTPYPDIAYVPNWDYQDEDNPMFLLDEQFNGTPHTVFATHKSSTGRINPDGYDSEFIYQMLKSFNTGNLTTGGEGESNLYAYMFLTTSPDDEYNRNPTLLQNEIQRYNPYYIIPLINDNYNRDVFVDVTWATQNYRYLTGILPKERIAKIIVLPALFAFTLEVDPPPTPEPNPLDILNKVIMKTGNPDTPTVSVFAYRRISTNNYFSSLGNTHVNHFINRTENAVFAYPMTGGDEPFVPSLLPVITATVYANKIYIWWNEPRVYMTPFQNIVQQKSTYKPKVWNAEWLLFPAPTLPADSKLFYYSVSGPTGFGFNLDIDISCVLSINYSFFFFYPSSGVYVTHRNYENVFVYSGDFAVPFITTQISEFYQNQSSRYNNQVNTAKFNIKSDKIITATKVSADVANASASLGGLHFGSAVASAGKASVDIAEGAKKIGDDVFALKGLHAKVDDIKRGAGHINSDYSQVGEIQQSINTGLSNSSNIILSKASDKERKNASYFYHLMGYLTHGNTLISKWSDIFTRASFVYLEAINFEDILNKEYINKIELNYLSAMFHQGLRLWKKDYLDYLVANWEHLTF